MNPIASNTSILVVAEHALVRAGLRSLLGATSGLAVVGEAADPVSATALAARVRPDVVLFDEPPARAEEESIVALRAAVPRACLLCLGEERQWHGATMRCIPPDAGVGELCAAVASLLGDRCGACRLRWACEVPRQAVTLSPREKQVAIHVAAGLASKQIAAALGIGLRTVNTYRESLARKLGASSAAVLTRYVLEHGLTGS